MVDAITMAQKLPEEVQRFLARLEESHYTPYLVGGCVRDLLLGRVPQDYDFTSSATPEELKELFGGDVRPTGLAHGTVTVVWEGKAFEITTMRCDGAYLDNRHPSGVRFTKNIFEDLARRDFTVNAMAYSMRDGLLDPYGGQKDLQEKLLRCVGEPEVRFAEDALRILRLLRFASQLGFSVQKATQCAARAQKSDLMHISQERVFSELERLLLGANVAEVLMQYPDILGVVLPEILPCIGFDQHNDHHCYDVWEHTARSVEAIPPERALRWTMLLHDLGKPHCFVQDEDGVGHFWGHTAVSLEMAQQILHRLHADRGLIQKVTALLSCFDDSFRPERREVHLEMVKIGRERLGALLETKLADNAAKAPLECANSQRRWKEAAEVYRLLCAEQAPDRVGMLAIDGNDLRRIGYTGRDIGAALQRLLTEVAQGRVENEHGALCMRAQRLYRSGWLKNPKPRDL